MNPYLERLKARTGQNPLVTAPTEPSKGASVGFDGPRNGRLSGRATAEALGATLGPSEDRATGSSDGPAKIAPRLATQAEAAEIRAHLGRLCGDHPDYPEALELALVDPVAALDAFRNPSARMLAAMEGGR